jgi:hypothetical protein
MAKVYTDELKKDFLQLEYEEFLREEDQARSDEQPPPMSEEVRKYERAKHSFNGC